ncbi:MAG: PD-(D/E)XK nuclease family protein [Candidatus Krumholzibacteria bacterium]|nr:PD-(D/E)XK nuclease family protein [Candidatus Krumholzibacteria bacterium]
MKKKLENTFSWSVSRDSVFRECPRKYYFNYYGHWGGWQSDADRRTRQIYVLKQLKNRATWIGQVVHACIARSLHNVSRGVPLLAVDEIRSITLSGMRRDFRDSTDGRYWQKPRVYHGFFEHEYDVEVSKEEWKEAADTIDHCLKTFYESETFEALRTLDSKDYLEVEEFSSTGLDGVEISNKLDCATRERDLAIVWDWKTGRREADTGLSLQMACYAYYAKQAFRVDLAHVETRRFDLYRNKLHKDSIRENAMQEMLDYVRGSMKDMLGLLDDPDRNVAREERFQKVERSAVCLKCNFLKVCMPSL